VERYFLQLPGYNILDTMGKGITLPEHLVFAERERERELHLGVISLNYINTARIVVDRQDAKAGEIPCICSTKHRAKTLAFAFCRLCFN